MADRELNSGADMIDQFDDFEPFEEIELTCGDALTADKPRLDSFIAQNVPDLSRAQVQKLIEQDLVWVNGKAARASHRLKEGDAISIKIPPAEPLDVVPEDLPLNVVFEDDQLIVVDKAAGMVTHPGAGVNQGTLVNALLYHCRSTLSGISGVERPGIVHRLDKDTSGLIVAAKTDLAHKHLAQQMSERKAKRTYIAVLEGILDADEGTVDQPIGRHPVKRKQMAISERGRRAVTHFTVLQRYRKFTLVECRLETGRTHQIRVHMAHLNCPVVGDLVYNRKSTGSEKARVKLGLKGQALHAKRLSFVHPKSGEVVVFEAPLPEDLQKLIASL